jgi:ribonuclease VapC
MVIDTSALLAILFDESMAPRLRAAMSFDPVRLMSTMSVLEATCVISARLGPVAVSELTLFLHEFRVEQVPFDAPQLELAQSAWLRFGRGFHGARLNFGDCASYALARFSGEPLLFVGEDFRQTDVAGVSYI